MPYNPDPDEVIEVSLTRNHWEALHRAALTDRNWQGVYSAGDKSDAQLKAEAIPVLKTAIACDSTAAGRFLSIGYRIIDQNPGHTTLKLFIGRTPGSRGGAGQIIVRTDEFNELVASHGWDNVDDADEPVATIVYDHGDGQYSAVRGKLSEFPGWDQSAIQDAGALGWKPDPNHD